VTSPGEDLPQLKATDVLQTWTESAPAEVEDLDLQTLSLERLLLAALPSDDERHDVGQLVGRGGMGKVLVAHDRRLRRPVALKELDERRATDVRSVASFIQEARLAARLDHPHIVPVHELGVRDGHRVFFTMKLVEGEDLASLVRRESIDGRTRDELLDLIEVIIKVCDALSSAHERGIVHCDIKPHNIMVGRFGAVYLMDWGLAREQADPDESEEPAAELEDDTGTWLEVSDERGVAGTPAYMPPEQARGLDVTQRSDVFALGACLYFVLTGKAPFSASTRKEALNWARRCAYRSPRELRADVPAGLEDIVLKAMAEQPKDRYPTAEAFKRALIGYMRAGTDFPRVRFKAGEWIIREGDVGDGAYIIVSGECEVSKVGEDGERRVLRVMGPDEVFGETAILADVPRTADVRALADSVLLEIRRDLFEREVESMAPWMGAFTKTLASRLAGR
jgi:serine/threonine-protein kinase